MARLHHRCPAHWYQAKRILPRRVVEDVLHTLARWKYRGQFAWHIYNEPLADPRLLAFIELAKRLMPQCGVVLWSNGWYLSRELAYELTDAGVNKFALSAYDETSHRRLLDIRGALRGRARVRVFDRTTGGLDNRLEIAETPSHRRCRAPLHDLSIYASGRLGLCCFDWREEVTFADLNTESFATALPRVFRRMRTLARELRRGQRRLPTCAKCNCKRHHVW